MYSPWDPGEESLWDRLVREPGPIALYGMGDGADKVLARCAHLGIPIAGVFANDEFVRGQSFRGHPVRTLAGLEAELPRFVALLCFATERPTVLEQIRRVGERHLLLVPDFPVAGENETTPDFVRAHRAPLAEVASLLADGHSRRVLRAVLRAKLTGNPDFLRAVWTGRDEAFSLLKPGPEECIVDAGAYTGDTAGELLRRAGGRCRSLLAIEPDRRNFRRLQTAMESLRPSNTAADFRCVNLAAWSGPAQLPFRQRSGRRAGLDPGGNPTPADSVDNLLAGAPCTLLKLDVEGAEREALAGAAETIRRHRPRVIAAAYHRGEDLFSIPLQLHALRPDYRLYLRQHPYLPAWETVCYAV